MTTFETSFPMSTFISPDFGFETQTQILYNADTKVIIDDA